MTSLPPSAVAPTGRCVCGGSCLRAPLSATQRALWLDEQANPGTVANILVQAVRVRVPIDREALETALQRTIDAHPVLRTTFDEQDGVPVQIVHDHRVAGWQVEDASDWTEEGMERRLAAETDRPFDLRAGPLARFLWLRRADDDNVLVVAIHHLVTDMWSMALLCREVVGHYLQALLGTGGSAVPPRGRYGDFVAAEDELVSGPAGADMLALWTAMLRDAPGSVRLPADRPTPPVRSGVGGIVSVDIGAELSRRMRVIAAATSTGVSDVLLAAFQVVLQRYGQDDLVIGGIAANRSVGTGRLLGCMVSPVPLRCDLSGDPTFEDLVRTTARTVDDAFARAAYPYQCVIEQSQRRGAIGGWPSLNVVYAWQKTNRAIDRDLATAMALDRPGLAAEVGGLRLESVRIGRRGVGSDLALVGAETADELMASLEYAVDVLDRSTVERIATHLRRALEEATADPLLPAAAVPIVGDLERAALEAAWAGPVLAVEPDLAVHVPFERQVRRTPERVAVRSGVESVTFAALNARANQLASHLLALGVTCGDRVGICLGRTVDMVAAVLAVAKAGGVFVPLDPRSPPTRLASVTRDASVGVVITAHDHVTAVHGLGLTVVSVDADAERISSCPSDDPNVPVRGDALVYVLATSGSTGRPKGVEVEHRNVVNYLRALAHGVGFGSHDVVLAVTALSFDPAVVDILLPLSCGAQVVLADDEATLDPSALIDLLDRHQVSFMQATPTTWRMLTDAGWSGAPSLTAICGGEPMDPGLGRALHARCGSLWNAYGPTETTVDATLHHVTDPPHSERVPIGRPIANVRCYVLDGRRQPVPFGVAGELHIGGDGVARGYTDRSELTAERFIPDPFSPVAGARMYRSGDICRLRPDGDLEHLGRTDHQVKIRGQRVELGEVEAALSTHPAVRAAVVTTDRAGSGDVRLAAYVVARGTERPSPATLRAHLQTRLPGVMIPVVYVHLEELPLTSNGKVDRARLPAPLDVATGRARPPLGVHERELASIWAEVLGRSDVGIDDDFFALGGHSLLATQIVSRVRARLGREIPVRAVFEHPTVAELAELLSSTSARSTHAPALVPADRSRPLALSGSQERMWFLHQLHPDSAAYNMAGAVRLRGDLVVPALATAIDDLVTRHEMLRTTFELCDGRPAQRVHDKSPSMLEVVDLRREQGGDHRAAAMAEMGAHARRPFRLDELPLVRFVLFVLDADDHVLFVNMHHIVGDQWSLGVLTRDLALCYRARANGVEPHLEPLDVHFADFVQWHRDWVASGAVDGQLAYWRRQLDGCPIVELPSDRPRPPALTGHGATVTASIPADLVEGIEHVCARHRVSPFMVLLAALDVVIHRYAGADDIAVGTPIANRNWLESEGLIGVFVNTLVMRTDLSGDPTFAELLERVRAVALDAYANQDVSFATLVRDLRSPREPSRSPLFQVFLNVQNAPGQAPALDGVTVELLDIDRGSTQFDLSVSVDLEQTNTITLEYSTDLFDADRIERMAGHLVAILHRAVADPGQQVGAMELLTEAERRVLDGWSAGPNRPRESGVGVQVLVERRVRSGPDRVAVRSADGLLTYAELEVRANRLAHHLIDSGVTRGGLVGVHLDRSVDALVSVLAVWKAGAAYLPLDPGLPSSRLEFMVEDAGATTLISRCAVEWSGLPESAIVVLDRDREAIERRATRDPGQGAGGRDLAHVIYTSGSTGRPKGVEVEHHSVVGFLEAMAESLGIDASDVVLASTTLSFDPSVLELFLPLVLGAQVLMAGPTAATDPVALAQVLASGGGTVMQATPTAWRMLIESGWAGDPALTVLYGGEAMPVELVRWLARRCRAVWNLYGPTESTVWTTAHRVDAATDLDTGRVPIGGPIANARCLVLDARRRPVPVGVPGELFIGGAGVGRGYANQPELTAERFVEGEPAAPGERLYRTGDIVRWTPGGVLEHLGRVDHQVKVRGHRVEPGEIEATLVTHPDVRAAVVTTYEPTPADVRLVAYYVPTRSGRPTTAELRDHLRRSLPASMIPSAYVALDELPLTATSKVDRSRLPAPSFAAGRADRRDPETALQAELAELWAEVLGRRDVGIDEDFFDLGGHSLLAARLFARIERVTGRSVPLSTLFQAPTVRLLAEAIDADGDGTRWTSLVAVQPRGDRVPFFYVAPFQITVLAFTNLARQLGPDQPFYVLQPQGMEGPQPIHHTVEEIAAHNIVEMRDVQPIGPYRLGGHCSGSWVAFEMARQLQAAGEDVDLLVLVDSEPPGITPPSVNWICLAAQRVVHYRRRGRLLDALRWQLHLLHERYVIRRRGRAQSRRVAEVRRVHAEAHRRYRGGTVSGDAVLVRSEDWAGLSDKAWHVRWQELLSGELSVELVPGGHAALVEPASSAELAATLHGLLGRVGALTVAVPVLRALLNRPELVELGSLV